MTHFTTETPVRIMFPNLRTPRAQRNGGPKYGVMVLVHKDSEELKQLKQSVVDAMEAKWNKTVPLKGRYNPIKSCKAADAVREAEGKAPMFDKLEDSDDYYFFNASNHDKPGYVDADVNPLVDLSCFKSGAYVRVNVNAYCWKEEEGVSIGLNHVQFVQEGPTLMNGSAASGGTPQAAFKGLGGKVASAGEVDELFG